MTKRLEKLLKTYYEDWLSDPPKLNLILHTRDEGSLMRQIAQELDDRVFVLDYAVQLLKALGKVQQSYTRYNGREWSIYS